MTRALSSTGRSRWLALVVLCAGMLMMVLDETVVNVALPYIQSDLGFSQSSLAWVVNAYIIAFGSLQLLAGRLGDLIGRKRILLAGLVVFTVASVVCGLSVSQEMLIAARFAQGVGGAMASALILGMIVTTFPEPRDQARAIGLFSFVAAAGGSIGLLAGGVLTQAINWHWVFFVNVPIGIVAVVLVIRLIETDRGIGFGEGADAIGAFLVTAGMMLGVYSIVGASDYGWGSARTLGLGAVALALLVGFVTRQATAFRPLLPLRIFRSRNVSGANLSQVLMISGLFGFFFLGTLYMQRVLGYDAMQIGLAFLPLAVAIGALSLEISARLVTRFGARPLLLAGLVLMLAGLLLFVRAPAQADYVIDILPVMLLVGIGAGVAFPALMTLAMSDATASDAGLASGLVNTTGQIGGALGLAVLATVATQHTDQLLARGEGAVAALMGGYQLAFVISAALLVLSIVVAATVLRPRTVAHSHEVTATRTSRVAPPAEPSATL
ncbi:MAG: family efflux transporter permease subunit [Chloroflexi bacterium]|nr:family efflux transporter permease subunit [Chloroflexota bacterium]